LCGARIQRFQARERLIQVQHPGIDRHGQSVRRIERDSALRSTTMRRSWRAATARKCSRSCRCSGSAENNFR
jgi:hypothetical protein